MSISQRVSFTAYPPYECTPFLTEALDHNSRGILPRPWAFGEGAPGISFVTELFFRMQNIAALIFETLVLVYIISGTRNPDATILISLWAGFFTVICYAPSNSIGGAGNSQGITCYDKP